MTAPANASWQGLSTGDGELLNLALSIDERDFLDLDLRRRLTEVYHGLEDEALDIYALHDPFAQQGPGRALAGVLGVHAEDVTCAAGTTSLLASVAELGSGGVYAWGPCYPDLPYWSARHGRAARPFVPDDVATLRPESLVLLDRPRLRDGDPSRGDVLAVAAALGERGSMLVVDESYGNYYPPAWSLANATSTTAGLVVLRGVSKGLWMGSLRVGAAVSSPSLTDRVRAAVPPMQVSALQAGLAESVWSAGDITSCLRTRIGEARPLLERVLFGAGLTPLDNHPGLPVLLLREDPDHAHEVLTGRGVLGKRQVLWDPVRGQNTYHYRVSVPLDEERLDRAVRSISRGAVRRDPSDPMS